MEEKGDILSVLKKSIDQYSYFHTILSIEQWNFDLFFLHKYDLQIRYFASWPEQITAKLEQRF